MKHKYVYCLLTVVVWSFLFIIFLQQWKFGKLAWGLMGHWETQREIKHTRRLSVLLFTWESFYHMHNYAHDAVFMCSVYSDCKCARVTPQVSGCRHLGTCMDCLPSPVFQSNLLACTLGHLFKPCDHGAISLTEVCQKSPFKEGLCIVNALKLPPLQLLLYL